MSCETWVEKPELKITHSFLHYRNFGTGTQLTGTLVHLMKSRRRVTNWEETSPANVTSQRPILGKEKDSVTLTIPQNKEGTGSGSCRTLGCPGKTGRDAPSLAIREGQSVSRRMEFRPFNRQKLHTENVDYLGGGAGDQNTEHGRQRITRGLLLPGSVLLGSGVVTSACYILQITD